MADSHTHSRKTAFTAVALALGVTAASCTSSVTSHKYDATKGVDGILYKLAATDLVVTATYELTSCTGGAKFSLISTSVAAQAVPDRDPTYWYMIDPSTLSNMFSSVNPAEFKLKNGMLESVQFVPKSEIREAAIQAAKIAGTLGGSRDNGPVIAGGQDITCSAAAIKSLAAMETMNASIKEWGDWLIVADKQLQAAPSQGTQIAVTHAATGAASAVAQRNAFRDQKLRKTVVIRHTPTANNLKTEIQPDAELFGDWFDQIPADTFNNAAKIAIEVRTEGNFKNVSEPGDAGFQGIYYRNPIMASVMLFNVNDKNKLITVLNDTPIMQLGGIAQMELRNKAFDSRGFTVNFAADGSLTLYKATATASGVDALTATNDVIVNEENAEIAALQRKIDIATKELALINAQKSLDAARTPPGSN